MKKFFLRIGLGIVFAATFVISIHLSLADTVTPNLSLVKPSVGSAGWGTTINNNYDTLDAPFASTSSGHEHLGTAGEGPRIALTTAVSGTLPVANGGTGATTASGARSNLGAAASGANTDITALTGLTAPAIGIGTASPSISLQIDGTSTTTSSIQATASSGTDAVQFIARRSLVGPAAVQSGDVLGVLSFRGYTGSGYSGSRAAIASSATENWTATANGTRVAFQTTPNGSTALATTMTLENDIVGMGTANLAADSKLEVAGHITSEGAEPAVSACGTTPTISGSDNAGKVTTGTGAITSCTLTFANAWAAAPACIANDETDLTVTWRAVSTTTTLVIDSPSVIASDVFSYICLGRG